jgi:glucose-1-phosphate cytidylyltransferase
MKAVILAGGLGTRISEETDLKPKPMIEVGGKPIIWHIMKSYSKHNITDFVICCGYKGYIIKEYFANYFLHTSDVTFNLNENSIEVHNKRTESWKVTLVDTGEDTMTGGRLKAVKQYLKDEEAFCFTYGDGVSDIDISESIDFHNKHGRLATVSAVVPPGRFGSLEIDGDSVIKFHEKPLGDGGMINGGYFVLSPAVIDLIDGPNCVWENEPLETLSNNNELKAFIHKGFWQPMDTLRDKNYLEELYVSNNAPWKTW